MARTRMLFIIVLLLITILGAWLWWVRPRTVDMSTYAPADSLVYLESNNPAEVFEALARTDAWNLVNDQLSNQWRTDSNGWTRKFVRWTGFGPVNSVVITRSQLAVVVTDLGVVRDEETLTIKPEGALLVETHTSANRIKPAVEQALKKFAETAYGEPILKQTTLDGFEFTEWIAPGGSRQVVATIAGTLVIVGNTERAVQKILAVALRRQPSLKDDQDLKTLRRDLNADQALAFGYVPAKSSGRLLSQAVPMILGRAPQNTEFERLIASASGKIVGTMGWSSTPLLGGIEDRYRIDLQPAMVAKLKESFLCQPADLSSNPVLPADFSSASYYRFQNPAMAWQGLKTSVASQIDALSAILFTSLLKSALLPYGIDEPDKFLSEVAGPLLTARLEPDTGGSVLIARMRDQTAMHDLLVKTMGFELTDPSANAQIFRNSKSEFEARFVNNSIAIGSPSDIARYFEEAASNPPGSPGPAPRIRFTPLSEGACVLTYANDSERVRAFVSNVVAAGGRTVVWSDRSERALRSLPYSATETNLAEHGIVRVTRSSLGQFSTLLPLVFPERRNK